jgi:diketogulonate reductase-like aldo/keto reductase
MNKLTDTYKLSNGVVIPCIGFGTWQAADGESATSAVQAALRVGYRHIDTAAAYKNESSVGAAIKESGIPREEIFVTSKLQNVVRGYEETLAAFDQTMTHLDMDYLDLYLIHWPNPVKFRDHWQVANADSWRAIEKLYKEGRIRSIGVSNFHPHHMEELMKTATIMPMVNQIRLCPGDTQESIVTYCTERDILLEAYSPLGTGKIFDSEKMQELARKYNKTIAQICIRWSLQMGFLPLPKSITASRIEENTQVFDFELLAEDVQLIADLKGVCGYSNNPDTATF